MRNIKLLYFSSVLSLWRWSARFALVLAATASFGSGGGALFAESPPDEMGVRAVTLDTSSNQPAGQGWWATAHDLSAAEIAASATPFDLDSRADGALPALSAQADWRPVSVPGNLVEQGISADGTRPMWYRRVLVVPSGVSAPLALRLGEISDRDEVYLNGQRVGATGDWDSANPQGYDRHRLYTLPDGLVRRGEANLLLVRVKGYFGYESGIIRNTTAIGPAEVLWREHYLSNFIAVLLLIVYATVGAYFLFLFLRRQADRENLFFALFAFGLVLYQFLRTQLKYELGLDFFTLKRLEYLTLSTLGFTSYSFVRYYFELPASRRLAWFDRLMWLPATISLAQFLLVLFTNDVQLWSSFNNLAFLPALLLFYVCGFLGIVIYGIVLKDSDAPLMCAGMIVFILAFFFDTLTHYGVFDFPRILGYVFVLFVLSLALILANRFVRLHTEVEDLNRNLEQKVARRTEELNNTLTEVRALKVQQDGDYFLTSLLVRPLGGNTSKSELASVDMIERQKKHFQFRNRDWEIGGDLNAAHDIRLRDRDYVLVLNGDAMGKSIQGAGGAIVLGTVFKSLVNRTRHSRTVRELSPEQWLKQAFLELQDTFVSFDGSMLVSVVIALLDEATGRVYYINAEHPWTVLYRDRKAEFIESDLTLRKVGIDVEGVTDGEMAVKLFELRPCDALIMGSGGRDDIVTGVSAEGRRMMNEDVMQFLRRVEDGAGQLPAIEAALRKQGEFSDDFTLVRLAYREDLPPAESEVSADDARRASECFQQARAKAKAGEPESAMQAYDAALQLDAAHRESLRGAAMLLIKAREYERAVTYCERYLNITPGDTSFCYYTASVYRQLQRYAEAVDLGERCRLRAPEHIENLLNLAQAYKAQGQTEREEFVLELARAVDPAHPKLRS